MNEKYSSLYDTQKVLENEKAQMGMFERRRAQKKTRNEKRKRETGTPFST